MNANPRLVEALRVLHELDAKELDAVRFLLNGDSSALKQHGIDVSALDGGATEPAEPREPGEGVRPEEGTAIEATEEDEPHPVTDPHDPLGPGFHVEEGDAPTGDGYYPGEPGA